MRALDIQYVLLLVAMHLASSFLLLVAMPGAPGASLLLVIVVRPGAPSSFLLLVVSSVYPHIF